MTLDLAGAQGPCYSRGTELPMVTRVLFDGFKNLRKLELRLSPFTVLVGPNGVGKSSVLDGLHLLLQLPQQPEDRAVEHRLGRAGLLLRGANAPSSLSTRPFGNGFGLQLTSKTGDQEVHFGLWPALGQDMGLKQALTTLQSGDKSLSHDPAHDQGEAAFYQRPELTLLPQPKRCRLEPRLCGQDSPAARGEVGLAEDGRGLPTLVNHLISSRDGSIERLEQQLSAIIPGVRRLHTVSRELSFHRQEILTIDGAAVPRTVEYKEPGWSLEVEYEGKGRIPASQLSEGTLLVIAILALAGAPGRQRLLLLDDIDRGLHPAAQQELIGQLRRMLDQDQNLQIITTAHSDTLIMGCAPEEVIRLDFGADGYAVQTPVVGDPRWMTPSEVTEGWFGVSRTGQDDLIQRYALLAGDPHRSEEEEALVQDLARQLYAQGARGLPPIEPRSLG